MQRLAPLLLVLLACAIAHALPPDALDDADGLTAAQARIDAALRRGVEHDEETQELVLDSSAEPARFSLPCTFDVEWGSGHGGSLDLVRLSVGLETTSVEHLTYVAERRGRPPVRRARRADVPTGDVVPLLQLARAEARTTVEVRRRPGVTRLGARLSGSSRDFFVLTRVLDGERRALEREFAGYAGSLGSREYAGIDAVVRAVRDRLEEVPAWTEVPAADLRRTHLTAAFTANEELMLRDFHWWVMERSVEALGTFGTVDALPTLLRLDRDYADPQPRQRAKIHNVIARPGHYLAGEPKAIPEELDAEATDAPDAGTPPEPPDERR